MNKFIDHHFLSSQASHFHFSHTTKTQAKNSTTKQEKDSIDSYYYYKIKEE